MVDFETFDTHKSKESCWKYHFISPKTINSFLMHLENIIDDGKIRKWDFLAIKISVFCQSWYPKVIVPFLKQEGRL